MTKTLFKKLEPTDFDVAQETPYVMRKQCALSLILGMIRLRLNFPLIGVPEELHHECLLELRDLGIIVSSSASSSGCQHSLTEFGADVASHSMDIHVGVITAVSARFDLAWHGRIAAAYVQASKEFFLRSKVATTCGLLPEQMVCGRSVGFAAEWGMQGQESLPVSSLLTGVHTYLKSVAEGTRLNPEVFSTQWLRHMHENLRMHSSGRHLATLTSTMAGELLAAPNWEEAVTLAVVWAHRDHVAYHVGDDVYRSVLGVTSQLRLDNLDPEGDFENVRISEIDLSHSWNRHPTGAKQTWSWIVFTNLHRYPIVSGVTPLPRQIGALFAKHVVQWSPQGVQQLALQGFKNFLTGAISQEDAEKVIRAVRPLLCYEAVPVQTMTSQVDPQDDSAEEGPVESEAMPTHVVMSIVPQISEWSQALVLRMEQLVNDIENLDEMIELFNDAKT